MSFQPIKNYGVIGNMRSIALVGVHGSIDFLCYPNFDSPTVFAALLDAKQGGSFHIEPQLTNVRVRQLYLPDTNILLTRFLAEEGVAELADYMPIKTGGEQPNEIVRTVSVIRGNVQFAMRCQPRFNYARTGPLDKWQRTRDDIRSDIFTNFWSDRLQSFVQAKGTEELDASTLLMPMMRFISPVDPMWLSTMRALERTLIEDTLVRRYDDRTHVDGLPAGEGSFTACSFWYVECLARAGDLEKAQLLFEKLLGYANHLGLYSEELGADGRHLGNFPQAFTHLALISAATYLDRALSGNLEAVWR